MTEVLANSMVLVILQYIKCIKSTSCTCYLHNIVHQLYLNKVDNKKFKKSCYK